MRYTVFVFFAFLAFVSAAPSQNRQQAIDKFEELRRQAEIAEKIIASPDKEDIEEAKRQDVSVFRLLPRESYDNRGLFSTRGGHAYYSFYFRIPDWGHGSDLGLEQNMLSTGFSGFGLMADLGEMPLSEITKSSQSANILTNYQFDRNEGLKPDETIFKRYLPAVSGHTYVVRSSVTNYYDVLVAFKIYRKDTDGSLIIFWKQLEQFETPQRNSAQKPQVTDDEILKKTKGWFRSDTFPNVQVEVKDAVITLRGSLPKAKIAYAVQLANSAGAVKVVNFLSVE